MKKTRKSITTLASLALASALLLGACGSNKQQATNTSSSSTSQSSSSSSSKKAASSAASSASSSSTASSSQAETATSSTGVITSDVIASQASSAAAAPDATETSAASSQVATQDESVFAHLVGTWANDLGYTITINPDGTASDGAKLEAEDGVVRGIRSKEGFGAAVIYAPAGQEFSLEEQYKHFTEGTDISRERLVIAQSVDGMAHPYYRTN